ncbi:hypothetical protein HZH66_000474 [Vespula vulgaris]|uniref:Uncharacterized protein n=1 Tax=Vespula vulgaris TaxID=7454 RepID=A0A834KRQ8_VESVU|nr:hypothetical protein HZH66_000474 [Vespula vulgaris]
MFKGVQEKPLKSKEDNRRGLGSCNEKRVTTTTTTIFNINTTTTTTTTTTVTISINDNATATGNNVKPCDAVIASTRSFLGRESYTGCFQEEKNSHVKNYCARARHYEELAMVGREEEEKEEKEEKVYSTKQRRNVGTLERRNVGTLRWNATLEHWNVGTLERTTMDARELMVAVFDRPRRHSPTQHAERLSVAPEPAPKRKGEKINRKPASSRAVPPTHWRGVRSQSSGKWQMQDCVMDVSMWISTTQQTQGPSSNVVHFLPTMSTMVAVETLNLKGIPSQHTSRVTH